MIAALRQLRTRLATAVAVLRHAPDRLLHKHRHRRAVAAIPQLDVGSRVVVVCYGNICRSPYTAAALRRLLDGTGVLVESAGFVGPGRPVPAHAHATALGRGDDMSAHRAQLLTEPMVRGAQLIVVMDTAQRARLIRRTPDAPTLLLLGDLDPQPIAKRAIRDPYAQSLDVFAEVFDRIDRSTAVLARGIRANRGA
jgi:protein-tyrosine phosphatase